MKFFLAPLLLILILAFSEKPTPIENAGNIKKIDSLITSAYLHGRFNGNILIAKEGHILYTNSLGFANGSKHKLSINDKFLIGSIYKEIPAI